MAHPPVPEHSRPAKTPHARWPYRWLIAGGAGIGASFCWPPLHEGPALVLLGKDQSMWQWLIALVSVLTAGIGLLGILHSYGRNHDAWWQGLLLTFTGSGVVLATSIAALPTLAFTVLGSDSSYRDLSNAHGDGVVVALHPSNGYTDSELLFGTRHGIWVDFDPSTRRIVANDATLRDWYFTLITTSTSRQVRYAPTAGGSEPEVITLSRVPAP